MPSISASSRILPFLFLMLFINVKTSQIRLNEDSQGDFTPEMLAVIKNIITYSNAKYPQTRLAQIAQYISTQLGKAQQPFWDVIVFDNTTTQSYVSAPYAYNNQWLAWYHYGTFQLGYHIEKQVICIAKMEEDMQTVNISRSSSLQLKTPYQDWGRGISASLKSQIRGHISNAIVYNGENLQKNAIYIQQKLSGAWGVLVGQTGKDYNFLVCVLKNSYAILEGYEIYGWTYFIYKQA